MSKRPGSLHCALTLALALLALPTTAADGGWFDDPDPVTIPPGAVWVLTIDDAIGPATSDYITRGMAKAQTLDASLVVIKMDTPGGLDTSMRDIIQAILASRVPIATYVYPKGARAASAGTYILYASHIAAMSPATNLGSATPVQIGVPSPPTSPNAPESEAPEASGPNAMEMKIKNDAIAHIRGLAELRGRNADWAEKAVREAASLPSNDALEMNVIDLIAVDLEDLLTQVDGREVEIEGEVVSIATAGKPIQLADPDWRTEFLKVITNPNLVLILGMIGIYGIILEFYNPGVGIPGVVGAICLLLAGYALQMLPVNFAGLALIILGIGLMIAESMVPSFGIMGFGGIVAFIIGSIILMDTDVESFQIGIPVIAALALVSGAFFIITLGLFMKVRKQDVVSGAHTMVGMKGEAIEDFEAKGHVKVGSEIWRVECDGAIAKGDSVRVVSVEGLHLTVEKEE